MSCLYCPCLRKLVQSLPERCPRGSWCRSRKAVVAQVARGFESHPLRCPDGGQSKSECDMMHGEVLERLNRHAWKACDRVTGPWVQIPPSPPQVGGALSGRLLLYWEAVQGWAGKGIWLQKVSRRASRRRTRRR